MATEKHSPLDQFTIQEWIPIQIGDFNISFTNSSFYMVTIVLLIWVFVVGGMRRGAAVPGRWQSTVEIFYEFIGSMLYDTVGPEARRFFPFVFSLFMFILFANLSGMIPYTFTITSHIIVTFAFAALVFLLVTLMGFINHGFKFFKIFLPSGVPLLLAPLLVVIELISYLIRPISLSVRLFANMMAGHIMLKVLAGFIVPLGAYYLVPALLPLLSVVALTGLEIVIAFLQAYVFAMLTCIYLNDAYHVDH
ncbi:MAG: F0F1 ATP synthase subunit A [Alphaproteobacteria bacterium]